METAKEWGCNTLFVIAGIIFFIYITGPSGDQVCRHTKVPILDSIHGTDVQPTCQEYMRQIERRAIDAERKAADLESRIEEIEDRLNI